MGTQIPILGTPVYLHRMRTIQVTKVVPWVGSVKVPEDLSTEGPVEITGDRILALFEDFDVMIFHGTKGTWLGLDQKGRMFRQR